VVRAAVAAIRRFAARDGNVGPPNRYLELLGSLNVGAVKQCFTVPRRNFVDAFGVENASVRNH
jgi:hypothetical protein